MARNSFKEWTQNVQSAREGLRKAQRKVGELESVAILVKDARIDVLDELRNELQHEFNEAYSRQHRQDNQSGYVRGLGRAIELVDNLKKVVRDGEIGQY